MAAPRHQLADPSVPGYFHCVTRCVRRAFLCGLDALSGRSFDHRKAWIESRPIELAGNFAFGLYDYAVMSNDVHAVIHVDPGAVAGWPDAGVAEGWVRVFPARATGEVDPGVASDAAMPFSATPTVLPCAANDWATCRGSCAAWPSPLDSWVSRTE